MANKACFKTEGKTVEDKFVTVLRRVGGLGEIMGGSPSMSCPLSLSIMKPDVVF